VIFYAGHGTAVLAWRESNLKVFEGSPDWLIFIVLLSWMSYRWHGPHRGLASTIGDRHVRDNRMLVAANRRMETRMVVIRKSENSPRSSCASSWCAGRAIATSGFGVRRQLWVNIGSLSRAPQENTSVC
jgi:hypothetical protein